MVGVLPALLIPNIVRGITGSSDGGGPGGDRCWAGGGFRREETPGRGPGNSGGELGDAGGGGGAVLALEVELEDVE